MARAKLEPRHSHHYLTFDVMNRDVRTLSGSTWCCLPPPSLDFRRPIEADVRGRKLRFVAASRPAAMFEQDSVAFGRLGDVLPGMVVVVVLGAHAPGKRNTAVVQLVGLAHPRALGKAR